MTSGISATSARPLTAQQLVVLRRYADPGGPDEDSYRQIPGRFVRTALTILQRRGLITQATRGVHTVTSAGLQVLTDITTCATPTPA